MKAFERPTIKTYGTVEELTEDYHEYDNVK